MVANVENTKQEGTYFKCKGCKIEINHNTNKMVVHCKCGLIWVDGCEYYFRVGGKREDFETIKK